MKRGIIAAVLTAGLLALGGTASAQEADCSAFARTQTYRGWGPALHYGETVTVSYSASECSGGLVDDRFTYSLSGTATVYAGTEVGGTPLDVSEFVSEGSFRDPDGSGWPPSWWSCDVRSAAIGWTMPGVYSFVAGATNGAWTLEVTVPGADTVRWTHSAC